MLTVDAFSASGVDSIASATIRRRGTRRSSRPGWPLERSRALSPTRPALDLHELTDINPLSIHVTVPRARRGLHPPVGVTLHTTIEPLSDDEVTIREGVRLTTPERTLLDVVEAGTAPEQVVQGIRTAIARGWVTPSSIGSHARERGARVSNLVAQALGEKAAST